MYAVKMCHRYIGLSRIGRNRRIAITLPGTEVAVQICW